jgi:hypothetical protein
MCKFNSLSLLIMEPTSKLTGIALTAIFILMTVASPLKGQGCETPANKAKQKKWIKTTIAGLKKDKTLAVVAVTETEIQSVPGFKMISYRVNGPTRILCSGGEWIYFKPHSGHESSDIGDVCIAITEKGRIYINYGHICGGIVHFINKKGELPADASEFFDAFISDTDDKPWIAW